MSLKTLFLIICLGICVSAKVAKLTVGEDAYLNEKFKDIPEGDRKRVLYHQLFLGYLLQNPELEPKEYNMPKEDTVKIYELFLAKFKLKPVDMYTICFADGDCVDPSDSGLYPG